MKNWRLKKTLARRIETRPIEDADVRYAWASYKLGKFPIIADGLAAAKFKSAFETMVLTTYPATWVVSAESSKGFMPVGIVFASFAPLNAYLIIMGISWFPWATKRNILEGTVAFFNMLRKQLAWVGYANDEHKRLYEVCCMHGIMRRVGTSHVVFPDGPAAVFEGKKP